MAILQPLLISKFNYGTALGEIVATFITGSTLDSIDWTSTATMATHAIIHCNTSVRLRTFLKENVDSLIFKCVCKKCGERSL
jgi:hypothetical protein